MLKKTFLRLTLILASLSVVTGATGAVFAQAAQDTPESAAKAYFAAMQASDWAKLASLTHPDALASIKRMFATAIKSDQTGDAAKTIFKLKSAAEYSQLSDAAVFERLMDFITSVEPDMKTALSSSTNTILGKVDESPDLAHVVFRSRSKLAGDEVNEVDLLSFKKQDSAWRALLSSDLEGILSQLADEVAPPQKEEQNTPPGAGRPTRRP
jgi:hypothetical protein